MERNFSNYLYKTFNPEILFLVFSIFSESHPMKKDFLIRLQHLNQMKRAQG